MKCKKQRAVNSVYYLIFIEYYIGDRISEIISASGKTFTVEVMSDKEV